MEPEILYSNEELTTQIVIDACETKARDFSVNSQVHVKKQHVVHTVTDVRIRKSVYEDNYLFTWRVFCHIP